MICGVSYLVKSKPTFYTLWRQWYGSTWMRMRHIQLGERGRGRQVKYADGHCTKTFLQSLIKYRYYGENILALNFIFRILFPSIKYIIINSWMFLVGLKQKFFSFLYFRENFAKIYRFSRNNHTKIYKNNKHFRENWCENFCENENFYEHFSNNLTYWYNHI
jgi:hypothetical protein